MKGYHLLDPTGNPIDGEKSTPSYRHVRWRAPHSVPLWLFITSLLINLGLVVSKLYNGNPNQNLDGYRSPYAHLKNDVPMPMTHRTDYGSGNLTFASPLWQAIEFDPGIVALSHEWADAEGIPHGQTFPWDTSKGMYVLNGYHQMHCLKVVHLYITEIEFGQNTTYPLQHITHCLDSLRLEVMCQADDTPRYTSSEHTHENGVGQIRRCKDWNQLSLWAKDHTACYRYLNKAADDDDQIERFKFCPPGSPYLSKVRDYFGLPPGWVHDNHL